MTQPVHHNGVSPASVSPDMYSSPNFVNAGAESPTSFSRPSHIQGHSSQEGYYHPYGSPPYSQYSLQQQHDQYDEEQDHEASQMAGLQIHSPDCPGSPILLASARRQSFSSPMSSKKGDRGVIGPTRKSRSTSMSAGIGKRAPSKTRPSRTVPVTPTKELSRGLGISNDHIPEEEHQA
ncbi:hypothetical protein BGZ65_004424 [Modicella reniformis]|uniref:Uncharacterized protein n=1 Tax=Modicella reniformis TaxID=1440133 RepID=A0A9P6J1R8_9FUNG|nr:hypothetical protein BGZ65_004424 [Modicella reniformis]